MRSYTNFNEKQKKLTKSLQVSKNSHTFATAKENQAIVILIEWRDGRVVECTGLENRRTERYRGFESLSLRNRVL